MRRWLLGSTVLMTAIAAWWAAGLAASFTISIAAELDRAGELSHIAPRAQATLVFDRHGKQAFSFYVEQRMDVPLDRVSPAMIQAILAVEDRRFYMHRGIDPIRIASAAWRNFQVGRIVQGGSTITQQLARAAQLSPERTYARKLREVLLAARLEQRYSKDQILQEYLNTVYFGEGYYGVEAASQGYFGKPAADLSAPEAALLAALVRSPSHYAPRSAPQRAMKRRNLVLRLMREQGRISEPEFVSASSAPIPDRAHRAAANLNASASAGTTGLYFQGEVRRQLFAKFGAERVLRGGLRVYTAYDPVLQREAERAITSRIAQIAKLRPRAKDLQGSLVALDPATGDVLAIVGGRDYEESSYNRATQAHRQAGSAFKPIIYAAALERGYAPGTILRDLDAPIAASGKMWLPDGEHEGSEYTLRRALKVSSNRAAAQLLNQVGVTTAVYYAQRMGIESDLPKVPSLALGTGEVTLLELTAAYGAFANEGRVAAPRIITRVEDSRGTAIWHGEMKQVQAISATTAYLMSSMLSDVVTGGTATAARAAGFKLPAAGKTGTTDDYADAWFVGYTPHLLTGVWFGLDVPAPIMRGGFGGVVAVPAWAQFMRAATAGAKPDWYSMPADVEKVAICRITGERAAEGCRDALPPVDVSVQAGLTPESMVPFESAPARVVEPNVYEDLFPVGTISSMPCHLHSAAGAAPGELEPSPSPTPLVDEIIRGASSSASRLSSDTQTSRFTPVNSPQPRLIIERVPAGDGTYRIVIRQRQQQQ